MRDNRVCTLLGIEFPIIQGGLAYVGNGALAAAVSNGGGFGQVGCGGRSPEDVARQIAVASAQTDKPFGVNFPISSHKDNKPYVDVILRHKEQIMAVSVAAGNPKPYIPLFKEAGLTVMAVTASVKHAVKAQELGADLIVCEGIEAGGHDSPLDLGLFALIPQVVQAVDLPVVAAGGMADGHGVVAAMALGADGVQMGTRFVATLECEAHDNYKQLLVEAGDDATVVLGRNLNFRLRVLNSPYAQKVLEFEKTHPTLEQFLPLVRGKQNRIAAIEGDVDDGWMNCGQSVGLIDSIESASDVVRQIARDAAAITASLHRVQHVFTSE
ncbi:NAD(P)H-dependent flavin oxidoreductase [Numidum massiliense]|uniref:NAD(P)H-dependent flavin oxidoreductase n=1 Tax=Numidum massiliense TaxID=1522315 RepID=UPI0006D597A2|nr:nitronate monooxygenase family protein [Numidum massiliense]